MLLTLLYPSSSAPVAIDPETVPAFPDLVLSSPCYTGSVPYQTNPLDLYYVIPCNLSNVPHLSINPDQASSLFPVITPKIDGLRINSQKGCSPKNTSTVTLGTDIGSDSVSNTSALSDTWDRPGATDIGVAQKVIQQTRMAFSTTDGIIAFFRTYSYDSCGQLLKISAETRKVVATAGPC